VSFLARNQIILAGIETTYGVDPTPAEGSNAILTKNLTRTLYEGTRVSRDLNLPYMGSDFSINTAPSVTVSFDVELAGSGTAGDVPQWGELLRACGCSETVVDTTSVTYAPVSKDFESVTIYYNYDGEMQKITGARGTVTLNMARGQLPTLSFSFTGLYSKPTTVAMYDPTYSAVSPLPFNSINTTAFSLHGQAVRGESFSLDFATNVIHRNLVGFNGVNITDRNPTATAAFEALDVGTKDFFAAMDSHSQSPVTGAMDIVHGATAGNIVTLSLPTTQISNISEQDSDGVRMFNASLMPVPSDSGNDEFSIALT